MNALSIFSNSWLTKLASLFLPSYYVSTTTQVAGSTVAGTYTDTGMALTLDAGTYDIEANGSVYMSGATGAGINGRFGVLQLTDSSNNVLQDVNGRNVHGCGGFGNAATPTTLGHITIKARVTLAAGTYKIRFATINNSAPETVTDASLYCGTAYGLASFKATKVIT